MFKKSFFFVYFIIIAVSYIGSEIPTYRSAKSKDFIEITVHKVEDIADGKKVEIELRNKFDKSPITLDDLKEVHTKKIHLLIIDSSLSDYSHIHPKPTKNPGFYDFEWHPTTSGNYRIWADITPKTFNDQEILMADLVSDQPNLTLDRTIFSEYITADYKFKLSFDSSELEAGMQYMGSIEISDLEGRPIKTLEPIMGAFGHIVVFSEDFKTIMHVHPMGQEPTNSRDRGGPMLEFHFEPTKSGFAKIFAQIKIDGQEIYIPFGTNVN